MCVSLISLARSSVICELHSTWSVDKYLCHFYTEERGWQCRVYGQTAKCCWGGGRWKNTKQDGSSIRTLFTMWRDINIQNWAEGRRHRKRGRGLRCLPSTYTGSNNNTEKSALVVWELSVWRSTMLKSHKIWRQAVLVFTTWCSRDWRICVKLFSAAVPSKKTSYS